MRTLQKGLIAGAGLDVFEAKPNVRQEFLRLEHLMLTPHIGSASRQTRSLMGRVAAKGLLSAFAGDEPENMVNGQIFEKFLSRAGGQICR